MDITVRDAILDQTSFLVSRYSDTLVSKWVLNQSTGSSVFYVGSTLDFFLPF